jgi:hypothetical protein
MGVFSWLSKAFKNPRAALGKAKEVINKIGGYYDKLKAGYGKAKSFVSNLPVVGGAANEYIQNAERMVGDKFKSTTGLGIGDVDKGIGIIRNAAQMIPS